MDAAKYHLHEAYWTELEPLTPRDGTDMHGLSLSVNWPHRPEDIDLLLTIGHGFIARDQVRRPLGMGMYMSYGSTEAMVGMMITHSRLQAGGLGREILARIEETLDGYRLRLNATRQAWRLYRAAGFQDAGTVVQYQGTAGRTEAVETPGLRPGRPEDLTDILALDRATFGADRAHVIRALHALSQVHVIEDAGKLVGFAFCRPFGRGRVLGPLAAPTETQAIALIAPFVQAFSGQFLRLDADGRHRDLGHWLNASGLASYDTVVPMTKGAPFGPEDAPTVYALAGQALG